MQLFAGLKRIILLNKGIVVGWDFNVYSSLLLKKIAFGFNGVQKWLIKKGVDGLEILLFWILLVVELKFIMFLLIKVILMWEEFLE